MLKSPAFQFYIKQWLGDDKILLMSWTARGMHVHLMCIAWQQEDPCTLPDDDELLQAWLNYPPDYESLKRQIFRAWKKREDGRFVQEGLLREYLKQSDFRDSRSRAAKARWNPDEQQMECTRNARASDLHIQNEGFADAHALHMQCSSSSSSSSSSTTDKKEVPPPPCPEVELWNSKEQLPKVKTVSDARWKRLKARRKDPFFVANLPAAIDRIVQSNFLMGKNDRGWVADFDWLLQPDSVARIIEGKYDNREATLNVFPQEQLAAVQKLILNHAANPQGRRYSANCSQTDRDDLKQLRQKEHELTNQIARARK